MSRSHRNRKFGAAILKKKKKKITYLFGRGVRAITGHQHHHHHGSWSLTFPFYVCWWSYCCCYVSCVCVFHFLFVPPSLLVFLYFRPGRRRSHLAAVAVTAVGSDSTVLLCSFIFRVVVCEAISRRSPIRHFGHFERNALIFFVNFDFCRAEPSSGG